MNYDDFPGIGDMTDSPPGGNAVSTPSRPASENRGRATEHLWKTLQVINEWTRFADAKAGAVLTANGVLGTLAAGFVKDHWKSLQGHPVLRFTALFGGLFLLLSAIACIKCLLPKTRVKSTSEVRSRLFFSHIALDDEAKYLASAENLGDDNEAFREVARQVWANAIVASEKHWEVFWAILLAGLGIACASAVWVVVLLNP